MVAPIDHIDVCRL